MGNLSYKLLATDMDGTLLMDNKVLSKENIDALCIAKKHGVEIAICTGRPYATVKPYIAQLDFDCWVITNNGAVIRNKEGKVISVKYINPKVLQETIDILKKEEVYFHISDEKYTYIESYKERFKNLQGFISITGASKLKTSLISFKSLFLDKSHKKVDFANFSKEGNKAASIFIVSDNKQKLNDIRNKLKKVSGIDVTSSGRNNIEILDKNATKGVALKDLSRVLNIDKDVIIAVGDNYNDLSMIEYAGLGIAVKNAEEDIIQKADWITKSNEEHGIAHIVEYFIEKSEEKLRT